MHQKAIVIGGGLAGLAAAAALAEHDVRVTLLESRPRLGGRASSFVDRATGMQIDNCQHVSMGCCTNFAHFCDSVGLNDFFRWEDSLNFIAPDGRNHRLASSGMPAPLHLAWSFWRMGYLSVREKIGIARALRQLARIDPASCYDETFDAWLIRHRQSPSAIARFWQVVLVSALSESLDRIDVANARKVFVDAFLRNSNGWRVQISTVPLDTLYGTTLTEWFASRGANIRLKSGVERLLMENDRVSGVVLRDGQQLTADHFVLAVPHQLVRSLLPGELKRHSGLTELDQLESAPISSVHLWFDRRITKLPHAVFIDRLSQWMFNRSLLSSQNRTECKQPTESLTDVDQAFYYQIVISASRELSQSSREETIAKIVQELTDVWPVTGRARLVHSRLITEHNAVFSVKPGADRLRPHQQSPIRNLQLAGDWTKTGWPATMEGAVRSGYLAAENVLAQLNRPEKLLQPDLADCLLSKLLIGL